MQLIPRSRWALPSPISCLNSTARYLWGEPPRSPLFQLLPSPTEIKGGLGQFVWECDRILGPNENTLFLFHTLWSSNRHATLGEFWIMNLLEYIVVSTENSRIIRMLCIDYWLISSSNSDHCFYSLLSIKLVWMIPLFMPSYQGLFQ